jgi:FR47-like protein
VSEQHVLDNPIRASLLGPHAHFAVRPLIHASASNVNAIRLYESLGFALRRHTRFVGLRVLAPEAVA